MPQYRGINEQRCYRRSLQRDAGTSPSSSMAQRLAQSRFRRTGPSFCVSRRAGKCQRQWHRVYPGATLYVILFFSSNLQTYVNKIDTLQLCLRESNKHKWSRGVLVRIKLNFQRMAIKHSKMFKILSETVDYAFIKLRSAEKVTLQLL